MSQTQIAQGAAQIGADFTAIAADTAIPRLSVLTPATIALGRGAVNLCSADGSTPCGLALQGAAQGAAVQGQAVGVVSGTTAEWDAVQDTVTGGLSPLAQYFVSQANAGKITDVQPTPGQSFVPVGLALSPTTMLLMLQFPTVAA